MVGQDSTHIWQLACGKNAGKPLRSWGDKLHANIVDCQNYRLFYLILGSRLQIVDGTVARLRIHV